jgi:hypothetical protein
MEAALPSEARTSTRPAMIGRVTSRHSLDSDTFAAETSPVNPVTMPSLRRDDSQFSHSSQYERLISGQESEIGEAPPTYTASLGIPI